eukprot:scaffold174262_cov19-Prasinocladus_malaysianus.AAC.1
MVAAKSKSPWHQRSILGCDLNHARRQRASNFPTRDSDRVRLKRQSSNRSMRLGCDDHSTPVTMAINTNSPCVGANDDRCFRQHRSRCHYHC